MATEVDICNLALGHLGDNATIASLKPPEGSAQAEHAARFYPISRDTLLESHSWNFATRRSTPAAVANPIAQWKYAYALPNDCMDIIGVIDPSAENDYVTRASAADNQGNYAPTVSAGLYVPQPFTVETDANGVPVLYTNVQNALLRFQAYVTDTTTFSSLFTLTLSWHLASMLAGPVIKGEVGQAEGKRCAQMMAAFLQQAKNSDLTNRKISLEHIVPWTAGR
tara:strand:- start:4018 stop:4689 length:672 start_codon:yes stop_codon:yes gene_type:complete